MKKMAIRVMALVLCFILCTIPARGVEYLIPVGQVIGLELADHTVTVADFDATLGTMARQAGLQPGDQLLQIDDTVIQSTADVRKALDHSNGTVRLRFGRNGKCHEVTLQPQITRDGPKIGIFLKQGVTGIGTVTWYDPDNHTFAALGHGVNSRDGKLLQMAEGQVFAAHILSVQPGAVGKPGQLRGAVAGSKEIGTLQRNTQRGVFGTVENGWQGQALPVASADEVQTGSATILSTVSREGVREYSVEIVKIYPKTRTGDKNMVIRITDQALLEATGGIVQGMSGSPIIQDGKLVGAVTHVLVNDPTTGYGIFIENMLDAAA